MQVHSKNFNVGVQALMLLYQISSKNQIVSDRFYRAVYAKLLTPAALTSSKVVVLQYLWSCFVYFSSEFYTVHLPIYSINRLSWLYYFHIADRFSECTSYKTSCFIIQNTADRHNYFSKCFQYQNTNKLNLFNESLLW